MSRRADSFDYHLKEGYDLRRRSKEEPHPTVALLLAVQASVEFAAAAAVSSSEWDPSHARLIDKLEGLN